MLLILICVFICITFGIVGIDKRKRRYEKEKENLYHSEPDYIDSFLTWFFWALLLIGTLWLCSQVYFGFVNTKNTEVSYSQPLASLNDGTGIEGKFSGSLFLSRGYVDDTQNFSYYIKNGDGSYALNKRDATRSTIWQDATTETARVDITDSISTCEGTWYSILCFKQPNEFLHAHFHIPPNSIANEFSLDAQ